MNTKDLGEKSEAKIMSVLLDKGLTVLKPWGDNKRYDFVVELNGFHRVQCKTGKLKNGSIDFSTKSVTTKNGEYVNVNYRGQADFFMVYCPDNKQVYCVKVEECGLDGCRLRLEIPKNKQSKGVRLAKDYELDQVFK